MASLSCILWPFFRNGPSSRTDAIVQDDFGAYEVRPVVRAARGGAVAIDAFGCEDVLAAIGCGWIHNLFVVRADGVAAGAYRAE